MGRRRRSKLIWLVSSVVLLVAVGIVNLVPGAHNQDGLALLFMLPVAIFSYSYGRIAALVSSVVAVAVVLLEHTLYSGGYSVLGTLIFALAIMSVGLGVAYVAHMEKGIASTDMKWFEMSNDMLVEASLDGYFTRLSDRWEEVLGWTKEELMSRPFKEFIHPDDLESTSLLADSLDVQPGEVVNFENRYVAKDGSYRWLLWCARSDHQRKYAVARDITERKILEQEREELISKVETLARTDSLTGLPNRRSWDELLRNEMARSKRSGQSIALAMIDLDHFKEYNDSNGHGAGDEFLIKAAAMWFSVLRDSDFIARYGGEEFTVLICD